MRPDVSVLMAVHNGVENYPPAMMHTNIRRAMADTRADQSDGLHVEFIICDDASTDKTPDVITRVALCFHYEGFVIKTARHDANRGPAATYQTAAEMATGRYVILQSVRSWYEPGAFAEMVKVLDENPDVGFVYGKTRYHGARQDTHTPPPYLPNRFRHNFDSLFGYMYRRESIDAGCRYVTYLERDGRYIDICDYDFMMQLIHVMGWRGKALRDKLCLNYWYDGEGQQTDFVHQHQDEIDRIFNERWGKYG